MSATVHRLPPPKPGRKRRIHSADACGEQSLRWMERTGEPVPANVARLEESPRVTRSPTLLLAISIFAALDHTAKGKVASNLSALRKAGDLDAHALLVALGWDWCA